MSTQFENTIAAIATPLGEGAISVIRVSGESAIKNVASRFQGKQDLTRAKSHTAHFGRILDAEGNILDEVVCTVFRGPKSFTGEDTVEINCHGGMHVTRRVLESILKAGACPAKPGEFTQRAFLNGKLDLSQAEAIADLIRAQSDKAYRTSLDQLEGSLSKKIHRIRDQLVESIGLLELELDFIEEGIELIDKQKVDNLITNSIQDVGKLINSYKYGRVWREGVRVALIGAPNAGKSSLLNVLLEEERSIVTDIPGTTRDFIEEKLTIAGILFRMIDTAGLRKAIDSIEEEGIKRTWKVAKRSDILVLVHDSTKSFNNDEIEFIGNIRKNENHKRLIILNNKSDLQSGISLQQSIVEGYPVIQTSTINLTGIEELKDLLIQGILENTDTGNRESITITNERHYSALIKAQEGLSLSLESLRSGESGEFIVVNLRRAIDSIGEIIGIVTTEDILKNIFSKFCIGK
jgi:tRNA modification GTPase